MLKIKDNVDLKELEKFGFRLKHNNIYHNSFYIKPKDIHLQKQFNENYTSDSQERILCQGTNIAIVIKDTASEFYIKKICYLTVKNHIQIFNTQVDEKDIQDIIQAGLVEKVEVQDDRKE